MADRYWVGGTGTWDTTSTANWSTSSGGASGASVPTAADSVFFNQTGTYTVTCTGALTCLDLTVSAGTVTLAQGTSPTFSISGSLFLVSGTVWSATGTITLNATTTGKTITTNGTILFGALTLGGAGGEWTLGSALAVAGGRSFQISQGSFITANFAVSCGAFVSTSGITRSISLGSSTITTGIGTTGVVVNFFAAGLTFNAGTSLITSSIQTATFSFDGLTFYDVSFTRTATTSSLNITGANTFRNLSFSGITTPGLASVVFSSNQTITGTLTVGAGTTAVCRTSLESSAIGTQRTLSCAAVSALSDIDFSDINFAGAVSLPITGTRLGDCKGNSNITFAATKTVYCAATGSASWGTSGAGIWAATPGGAADATMFPLAQDIAVFTATEPASGSTLTLNTIYNVGTLDASARTSATLIINNSSILNIYGDYIGAAGFSLSTLSSRRFFGRGLQKITSAGASSPSSIEIRSPGGTVQLQDALTITGPPFAASATLLVGTLDIQSYTLTVGSFDALSGAATRTLATGTGTIVCAGGPCNFASGVTITGTGTISMTGSSARSMLISGVTTLTINQGGAGQLLISGGGTFANITNTYSAVGPTRVLFGAAVTTTFTAFNLTGAPGAVCTIGSSVTGVASTLRKTGEWFVGANSTNGGNNTGLIFTAGGGIDYLSISNITGTRFPLSFASSVVEAASSTDAGVARVTYRSAVSEASSATDSLATALSVIAAVADSATGSDVIQPRYVAFPAVSETLTGADTAATIAVLTFGVAESVTAVDGILTIASLTFGTSDGISAADSPIATYTTYPRIQETATATDGIQALRFLPCVVIESTAAVEAVGTNTSLAVFVSDLATANDGAASPNAVFGAALAEAVMAVDVNIAQGALNAFVVDAATVYDAASSAFLWNPVDDSIDANWQNILAVQIPDWQSINNTQTPGWTPVSN